MYFMYFIVCNAINKLHVIANKNPRKISFSIYLVL